jgi:catalase (peroxidase I)
LFNGGITANHFFSGGPEIAFRGGRVDAIEPNAPGVPEPQQDLESHTASFARQGFSTEEMIALVACGHSFGSVQHSSFPDIVSPGENVEDEAGMTFDSTFSHFDNDVQVLFVAHALSC